MNCIALICGMLLLSALPMAGQDRATVDTIRYVKTNGSYTNNGRSWSAAKNDIQDAINDLHEYLKENDLSSGSIYVAAGTYKPSESTELDGGGLQFTAFKIYPGIHLYGGFAADETDEDADPFTMEGNDFKYRPHDHSLPSLESGQKAKTQPWNFQHKTILSGSHNAEPSFKFDKAKGIYNTLFYGNSYHVVWFATEGFIPTDNPEQAQHALPLSQPASLDGFTIIGGNAATKTTTERLHTAYGGGAYMTSGATLSRCVVHHCEATMRGGGVYLDGGGLVDKCHIHTCHAPGVGIMQGYGGGVCIDYDGAVTRSYILNNSSRIGAGVALCHTPEEYPWQSLDDWRTENGSTPTGLINDYSPHATACIVSNNTSTAEGAGVYFFHGGTGNHLTVTRNNCVGQDITYYGRRHGRSGGVYILNGGQIYNSVIWGNKCEANDDIQYAVNTANSTDDLKPQIYYSAVEKHDITDWAGTTKTNIMSLESQNTNTAHNEANYPYFIGIDGRGKLMGVAGAGLDPSLAPGTVDPDYDQTDPNSVPDPAKTALPRPIYWKAAAISSMAKQGLQVTDALEVASPWIRHAHTDTDLFADRYEPLSTFGALICRDEQIRCTIIKNQEIEQYTERGFTQARFDAYANAVVQGAQQQQVLLKDVLPDDGTEPSLPTIFVDPSRNAGECNIAIGDTDIGATWDKPVKNINDAIYYFKQCLRRSNDGGSTFVYDGESPVWYDSNGDCCYHVPTAFDANGEATSYQDFKHVQILVKGFERGNNVRATTAGRGAYLGNDLRTAAIRPASNMRIYGGYDQNSSGTHTGTRNARSTTSILSANITQSGYHNNSAHVIALINVRNVIIDGLKLTDGNANLNANESYAPIDPATGEAMPIAFGGGIIVNNMSRPVEERIDMTGNILRSARIANCSAPNGAAVYVNGGNLKSNGEYCKAELNIINTIIRNNTVGDGISDITDPSFGDAGVVTARGGGATVRIDHCDILNNCGYPLETLSTSETPEDYSQSTTPNPNEGTIRIYNSVMYVNGKIDRDNRKRIVQPLSCRSASNSQVNVDGDYIFLDWDAPKPKNPPHCFAVFCRDLSDQYEKWAIRKMDAFQQTVIEGGEPQMFMFDTEAEAQAYISAHPSPGIAADWSGWTWNHKQGALEEGPVQLDYPFFDNPSKNVGHSPEGDKPMNGGVVSYMPQNMNPMVNAAVAESATLWDSDGYLRNYGGAADIGAIEDRSLPEGGTVKYVRNVDGLDGGTDSNGLVHDGSSWSKAFRTITYALNQSTANAGQEIWVAAGTYTENITMKEGVNVYGGFIASGNPGKELKDGERNIGNNNTLYQTIVDGNASGRVLGQNDNYATPTEWEGFTFQNGSLAPSSITRLTTINESTTTTHYETYLKSVADSWGVTYSTTREDCAANAEGVVGTYAKEIAGTADDYDRTDVVSGTRQVDVTWNSGTQAYSHTPYIVDNTQNVGITQAEYRAYNTTNGQIQANQNKSDNYWGTGQQRVTMTSTTSSVYDYITESTSTYNPSGGSPTWNNYSSTNPYFRDGYGYWRTGTGGWFSSYTYYTRTYYDYNSWFRYRFYYEEEYEETAYYKTIQQPYRYKYTADIEETTYTKGGTYTYTDNRRGAGVRLFFNGILKNCLIRDNVMNLTTANLSGNNYGGAGADMNKGSRIESCVIRNNKIISNGVASACGAYVEEAIFINSMVVENYNTGGTNMTGAAMFVADEVSKFYNCTFAYNHGYGSKAAVGGIWHCGATGLHPSLFYNCIFWGNAGNGLTGENFVQIGRGSWADHVGDTGVMFNCYHSAPNANFANEGVTGTKGSRTVSDQTLVYTTGTSANTWSGTTCQSFSSLNNYYLLYRNALRDANLFNEKNYPLIEETDGTSENGEIRYTTRTTTSDNASWRTNNPYDINPACNLSQYCINMGDDTYGNVLKDDYEIVVDIVGDDRTQDCQIDKGAYEYNGAKEIKPGYELIAFDPERPTERELCAVYYVGSQGRGLATADSPGNMACPTKLQLVLDAAGRLRADLKAGSRTYSTEGVQTTGTVTAKYENITQSGNTKSVAQVAVAGQNLSEVKHVIVKLAEGTFNPQRSTEESMVTGAAEEIMPTRSLMIPHGVEVMGGYIANGTTTDFYEAYRDPMNHKTTFSGWVLNEQTGVTGQSYHVVTFTNNIYDTDQLIYKQNTLDGTDALADIAERAVIDGIAIEDGMATGTSNAEKGGGAAIVTNFGHVRNCILQNNEATLNGGALYLQPGALVSGCIMIDNEAEYGGAVYVEEPGETTLASMTEAERNAYYARIYNSTIVRNQSSVRGGGLVYETNLRAKGVVLWQNASNDMNNVAGVFDTGNEQSEANYPFAYCAVQARRLPGVNNIQLHAENERGTRWTRNSVGDMRWRGDKPYYSSADNKDAYYYIEKLSALVRSGMPYQVYATLRQSYPTLEYRDMAGIARAVELYDGTDVTYLKHLTLEPNKKNSSFLEIGARALNFQMGNNLDRPFTRLYVATPEVVDVENATALLESDDPLYSQQGSSMANPFQKFNDALDYIVALRNYGSADNPTDREKRAIYGDTRFEIYVAGGTYHPFHNARGEEGHARSSTFVVPEGVTITGGLKPDVYYCQDGYNFAFLQPMAGNNLLNKNSNGTMPARTNYDDFTVNGDYASNQRHVFLDSSNNPIATLSGITLVPAKTDAIWQDRPQADINGNNVFEPWEFEFETTFSGETARGVENEDNVYHVFTSLTDPAHVGTLPRRYSAYNDSQDGNRFSNQLSAVTDDDEATEHDNSVLHRMIIFNGVTITNGNARDLENENVKNLKHYYRGGGILIDGSWTNADEDSEEATPDAPGDRDIPLMLVRAQFQNNTAIQGGALYTNGTTNVFNCSFVQNYTQGPVSSSKLTATEMETARATVKYTGGGAIATNGILRVTNSIFANNEAMLGEAGVQLVSSAPGYEEQAFGGAIWGGEDSNIRLTNCNLVNNKSVSYPCVYINRGFLGQFRRFASNTIFWGNAITGEDAATLAGFSQITDINRDVFSYRTREEKEQEEAGTLDISFRQPMFFCAYRDTYGPIPKMTEGKVSIPNPASVPGATASIAATVPSGREYDPHEVPFLGESVNYYNLFGGNNNINITFANEGVNGPNFILPSASAGKDGYNPAANWMPARINNLTDNGWSYLIMTANTLSGDIEFKRVNSGNDNTTGDKPEDTMPDNIVSGGTYNFYSWMLRRMYHLTFMPLGEQFYMKYKNANLTDPSIGGESNMLRISSNPLTLDEAPAYIDLGVYEYQHRNLRINQNSEIDVLWVTESENIETGNDGYSWETPTSNLQAAIETLMRSRNDHHKQINIISGEYKPTNILGDSKDQSLSFTIQTHPYNNAAFTPQTGRDYGIRSLTLRGGYDKEIPGEAGYDFEKNKVTLSVEQRTSVDDNQLNHIVSIIDAEQYTTSVNESGVRSHAERGAAIPITFEGITFNNTLASGLDTDPTITLNKNNGGAAIYYREQTKLENINGQWQKGTVLLDAPRAGDYDPVHPELWQWDWSHASGQPKLTIRNCTFTQNGQEVANPTSAVYIEGGGGSSLIANSLFEHNAGDPVVGVNTTVLNSTFGLNGGHLKLTQSVEHNTQYQSEMHNSVIWRDDQRNSQTTQYELPTATYTPSATTLAPQARMTYNAITGMTADAQQNVDISDTNEDVLNGPNFTDPENGDFHLKPSKKLMNQGRNETYAHFVWPDYTAEPDVTIEGKTMKAYEALMQNLHPDQSTELERQTVINVGNKDIIITYTVLKATDDHDLAYKNRLHSSRIDRGAYECEDNGQRVIYMNPNKTTGTETGRTWEEAYGHGKLQTAIDAATIYSGEGQAYVFVKGQGEGNNTTEAPITFRDGVNVYGGIQNTSNPQAIPKDPTQEELEYTDEELTAFVNRIHAERRGLAAENATPTTITGINSVGGTYTEGALVDGFKITNEATATTPATSPVVNITIPNVALRNSIVTGNTMASGQPVVNLTGESLLYNTLVYGNTAETVVNVGSDGYVLNCTVVADHEGETPIAVATGSENHVQNTIAVNEATGRATTFAPYQRPTANVYTPAPFLTNHQPYWYQLHEESTDINAGTDDGTTAKTGGNTIAAHFPKFVNFDFDRDLLGNPRRLGGRVDKGAFETWKVTGERYATNETNAKSANDLNKYVSALTDESDPTFNGSTMLLKANYWDTNYGGHLYPHPGSVVYIDEDAVLSFERDGSDQPLFPGDKAIRPGYLLVKEGGSLYGNGNTIQAEYVAAERTMDGQYGLVALPFNYDVANAYTTEDGTQTLSGLTAAENAFYYDGSERSEWDYHFKDEDSECWKSLASTNVAANEGWLIDLEDKASLQSKPIRFTGWAAASGQYAYTENGTTKSVTLTQYDDRISTSGRADFTRQENMGWNLKGVPFLVRDYQTSPLADDTYQMNVPHVVYSTLGGSNATYGQFYTARSWDSGATLALGKAFFTQTAVVGDTETLYFKQPVYDGTAEAPVKESLMLFDEEEQADAVELHPQDGADAAMSYRLGSDGVKWFSLNDEATQLYVVNGDGTPLSLVSAAPVETEIPLGIRAGHEGRITIALPSPEVYADYENVWLTDHEAGISTDLRQGGYVMDISEAGIINNRLTLKFGGMPELARTEGPAIEKLAARGGRLPLRRYAADDLIRIHTASGALVYRGRYGNFSNSGLSDGIYIIER